MFLPSGLPIDEALPLLRAALRDHASAVLEAPPGAGKSTIVPLALLDEPWAAHKKILMLEPRRVAARAVARRMAQLLGEDVGQTVGYRMRFDTRVSGATRIEVLTEGVLTRMLQQDPALEDVAAIFCDEFHERSLQADLGLALTLDARTQIAPHLKLLVLSATLDTTAIADLLAKATRETAPVVRSAGRAFPVHIRYAGSGAPLLRDELGRGRERDALERAIAALVRRAVKEEQGGVLVFLPGAGEIRRVQAMLADLRDDRCMLHALYGDLPPREQDAALQPASSGTRKIVLATNIAETSLTIDGVRVVIDSGVARRAVFSPGTGMSTLELQRISRASADQRAGRAGRLSPGVCYRAWSESAQRSLAAFTAPEILSSDLAPLVLELSAWGAREPSDLHWLDPPPRAMFESARATLGLLGAIDAQGALTAEGRAMVRLPVHPRIARMLMRGGAHGAAENAILLAALLGDAAALRASSETDIAIRIQNLRRIVSGHGGSAGAGARADAAEGAGARAADSARADEGGFDRGTIARLRHTAKDLRRRIAGGNARSSDSAAPPGVLAALAFPDRIGRRREGDAPCFTLANGRGACFADAQRLAREDLIVAIDVDDRDRDARIRLAAALERSDLEAWFGADIRQENSVVWDSREQAVQARRNTWFRELLIESHPLLNVAGNAALTEEVSQAMLQGVRELGLSALEWTPAAVDLQARVRFLMRRARPDLRPADWPSFEPDVLLESIDDWLAPYLGGITRREHLARVPLAEALRARLNWQQQQLLDERVPAHVTVPSGSRIRIDFLDENAPAVAVRLQECFGLDESPRIAGVPLTFRLLSPAGRPVQITRDLAGFWRSSYADVRKDMRGRYPRHYWPENPLDAKPTRRVRRPTSPR